MNISRRAALALFPLTAVGLAGCGVFSTTTANGVTTVTVNLVTAEAYVSGVAAAAAAFAAFPGMPATVVSLVDATLAKINAAIPAMNKAAGGAQSFSFDTTSVPAFVTTLENDVGELLADGATLTASLGTNLPPQAMQYWTATVTIANALVALFRIASAQTAAATSTDMSVSQALALVHIEAPR